MFSGSGNCCFQKMGKLSVFIGPVKRDLTVVRSGEQMLVSPIATTGGRYECSQSDRQVKGTNSSFFGETLNWFTQSGGSFSTRGDLW